MTLEPPLIRVGLLGHGQAGAVLHAPLIEAAGAFRISVVATSRAETLAQRRDAPRQVTDARALIEADDVDLVVVATPNELHFEQALADGVRGAAMDARLERLSNRVAVSETVAQLAAGHLAGNGKPVR